MPERFEIIEKKELAPQIKEIDIYAPLIAKSAQAGQFVIVIPDEHGERIPLTIVDWSRNEGWIRLVFLEVGVSTIKLGLMNVGDKIYHVAGPLGNPSKVDYYGRVLVIGGGVANAALYPIARELRSKGNYVTAVIGARSANVLVYEDELKKVCNEVHVSTDDGSKGFKGYVSQLLDKILSENPHYDMAWIIGPAPMMKACAEVTKKHKIKAYASLNSLMVCGMGMCGACRIRVGNKVRFTCIDGPEFDAHEVDWDELINRLSMYREEEKKSLQILLNKLKG